MTKHKRKVAFLIATLLIFQTISSTQTTTAEEIGNESIPQAEMTTEETTAEETTSEEPTTEEPTTEEPTTISPYLPSKLNPAKSKVVVLDPGHGSNHHGAADNGLKEEVVVLDIAKYCYNELNQYDNITVYMTRTSKKCCNKLSLNNCLLSRNNYAKRLKANFLVSLHINADDSPKKNGAMILPAYSSGYHDNIRKETQALGKIVLKELSNLGIKNLGFWLRKISGQKYPNGAKADFYSIIRNGVLQNIPSLIVEHGYVTNKSDCEKYFNTKKKRKQLGIADATAIATYYGLHTNPFTGTFIKKGKSTYYVNSQGQKITGWIKDNGKWYYMNPKNGKMVKGFITIGNNRFYLNSSTGVMASDWFKVGTKTYFAKGNGVLFKGKIYTILGRKYYFNSKGALKKGWVTYKKKKYYFGKSTGAMLFGWQYINRRYYYFSKKTGKLTKRKR